MTTPNVQRLSDTVCAAGQLDPAAMAWAAANGFKSVINNRPDFEHGPDQPTSAAIAEAAQAAGLQYAFLPVAGRLSVAGRDREVRRTPRHAAAAHPRVLPQRRACAANCSRPGARAARGPFSASRRTPPGHPPAGSAPSEVRRA